MSSLDIILGEGSPEIEINGTRYTLKPLRLFDFGKFRGWVKQKRLTVFMKSAKEADLPLAQFTDVVDRILSARPKVNFESAVGEEVQVEDTVIEEMGTEDGMHRLVYLSVKKSHPDLEPEELDLGFEEIQKLTTIVGIITGLPMGEDGEDVDLEDLKENSENPPKEEVSND